jgi:hypothetical protein
MNRHLKDGEMLPMCEICGEKAAYCDSVPDPTKQGINLNECGYRLQPLCWIHAADRRSVSTSRIEQVTVCGDIARVFRGMASGESVCPDCGQVYYRHRTEEDSMRLLCDGSLVELQGANHDSTR